MPVEVKNFLSQKIFLGSGSAGFPVGSQAQCTGAERQWGRRSVGQDVMGQNFVGQDVTGAISLGQEVSGAGSRESYYRRHYTVDGWTWRLEEVLTENDRQTE